MSVSYNGRMYIVDNIICECNTYGHLNDSIDKWTMNGICDNFIIDQTKTAIMTNTTTYLSTNSNTHPFSFYYNSRESLLKKKPQLYLTYQKKLYIVDNVSLDVPIWSESKKKSYTINGKANKINIVNNIAYIE